MYVSFIILFMYVLCKMIESQINTDGLITALPRGASKVNKFYYSIDTPDGVNSMFQ